MPPLDTEESRWLSAYVLPHEQDLRSWLERRFPVADNIDDVIQESYLRVLKARESTALRSPRAFLFRTAKNLLLDHLKSHKVSRKIPYEESDFSDVVSTDEAIPEYVCRKQELEIMRAALQSLPERCRQVVTLHEVYGLSQREVAERLGIAASTVCEQLAIGIEKCTAFASRYREEARRGR